MKHFLIDLIDNVKMWPKFTNSWKIELVGLYVKQMPNQFFIRDICQMDIFVQIYLKWKKNFSHLRS